jgi:hypothetical protein
MWKRPIDRHHIVPRSKWGSDIDDNITNLKKNVHVALHTVFANLSPHEQFEKLMNINNTALGNDFKQDLYKIFTMNDIDYYYKKWILLRRDLSHILDVHGKEYTEHNRNVIKWRENPKWVLWKDKEKPKQLNILRELWKMDNKEVMDIREWIKKWLQKKR